MPFSATCPNCDARLQVPDALAGKRVKCRKCDEPFVVRAPVEDDDAPARPAKSAPPKAKVRRAAEDDEPRRPARSSRNADDDEDDEERPAPKRKKKKQKKGLPVGVVIGVIVGAVVLIGGGVAAAIFLTGDKKETTAAAGAPTAPNANPIGKGPPGGTAGGHELHEPDGKYRVRFPAPPQTQPLNLKGPNGPVALKLHMGMGGADRFISLHQAVTAAERMGKSDDELLDLSIEQARVAVQGATATNTKAITYQGFPGREIEMALPMNQGRVIQRVILAGDRAIAVGVIGAAVTADAPQVKAFFESLKIE